MKNDDALKKVQALIKSMCFTPNQIAEITLFTMKQMGLGRHVTERNNGHERSFPIVNDRGTYHKRTASQSA